MQPFNMVVGVWPLEVEVVPLVMLELPVHPCGVKVLDLPPESLQSI